MPIVDIQRRFRELGRLRMGRLVAVPGKRPRPEKLATWRLTTRWRHLLEAAIELGIGGEIVPWTPQGDDVAQWELITDVDRLPVVIPPGDVLSQWYELWSGGGCQRRCDGVTMVIDNGKTADRRCRCPEDPAERLAASKANPPTGCRETTRLVVMLPELPDLGVWRLESHGYYAAVELGGAANLVELATRQGTLIPATLGIEQRKIKRPGQPVKRFAVPVLGFRGNLGDTLTALGFVDGDRPTTPALEHHRPALTAGGEADLPDAPDNVERPDTERRPDGDFAHAKPVEAAPPLVPDEVDLGEPDAFAPPPAATEEEASATSGGLPPDRYLAMLARDAGLDDVDRRRTYKALVGKTSGKELTLEEVNRVAGILRNIKERAVVVGLTDGGDFTVYDVRAKRSLGGIPAAELVDAPPAAVEEADELVERLRAGEGTLDDAVAYLDRFDSAEDPGLDVELFDIAEAVIAASAGAPADPDEEVAEAELVDEGPVDDADQAVDAEEAVIVDDAPASAAATTPDSPPQRPAEPPPAQPPAESAEGNVEGGPPAGIPADPAELRALLKAHGVSIATVVRRTGKTNLAGIIADGTVLASLVAWLEDGAADA